MCVTRAATGAGPDVAAAAAAAAAAADAIAFEAFEENEDDMEWGFGFDDASAYQQFVDLTIGRDVALESADASVDLNGEQFQWSS